MSTSVSYDGRRLIPAPLVSISRERVESEDGGPLGPAFSVTLRGTLVAYKGSPDSTGQLWTQSGYPDDEEVPAQERLASLLRKQEAIRRLFVSDGAILEIQNAPAAPLKIRPRVRSVEFPEGPYHTVCEYVIVCEADYVEGLADAGLFESSPRVRGVSEEWSIEPLDENIGTLTLTHSLSATGKRLFDESGGLLDGKKPWENARDWVLTKLGLVPAMMAASGVLNGEGESLQAFNHFRTQSVGEYAGTFSCTERWVCYSPGSSPPATNDYEVSLRHNEQEDRTTVSLNGTVTGLLQRNADLSVNKTKWANAHDFWLAEVRPYLFTTAQELVGDDVALHPDPVASQVGLNENAGTITYSFEYNNRPDALVPGALSDSITVNHNHPGRIHAQIPIFGRAAGPVLQDIGTVGPRRTTVSLEAQMPSSKQGYLGSAPNTNGLVLSLMPAGTQVFLDSDEESFSPTTGRYSRNVTWTWQS